MKERFEQILLEILEIKKKKKEKKENKPHVRSATQNIPKDIDANIYNALIELRRKIYESKPSINFAYGNAVLLDIIRNKITDVEHINQKSRIKIDEKYAKLFSRRNEKNFPR